MSESNAMVFPRRLRAERSRDIVSKHAHLFFVTDLLHLDWKESVIAHGPRGRTNEIARGALCCLKQTVQDCMRSLSKVLSLTLSLSLSFFSPSFLKPPIAADLQMSEPSSESIWSKRRLRWKLSFPISEQRRDLGSWIRRRREPFRLGCMVCRVAGANLSAHADPVLDLVQHACV